MYHAYGMCVFITTILSKNAKIILVPRFTEESFLQTIQVNGQKSYARILLRSKKEKLTIFCFLLFHPRHMELPMRI